MSASSMQRPRVAVIGAGIIGTCTALVLQRRGCAVTLIDRDEPGMACSFGNGGAISPDFCVPSALPGMIKRVPRWFADPLGPLVIRWGHVPAALPWLLRWLSASRMSRVDAHSAALRALHAPCLSRYASLLGTHYDGLIENTGQLYVWKSPHASPTEMLARALRERHGVETQALDEALIREIDPELAPGYTRGLFFPDNGHTVNPLRLTQTLVRLFQETGGALVAAQVREFERQGAAVRALVGDAGWRLEVDTVVLAAGIQSGALARSLGDFVPLQAERGYHVMLPDPRVRPAVKIANRDLMFGMTPMEHGVRIAGTAEYAGIDAPMNPRRAEVLLEAAKRMYPRLNGEGASFWMGCRPSTPDSLPVVGRATRLSNLYYAFGHGGTGLTGAPMTAELIGQMLAGEACGIDASPYRVDRF